MNWVGIISAVSRGTTASRIAVVALTAGMVATSCSLLPGAPAGVGEGPCPAMVDLELVGAVLTETDGAVTIILRDGSELEPIWPRGYTTVQTDDGIEIIRRDGEVVAVGDVVDLNAWNEGDKLRICAIRPHDPSLLEPDE